MLAECTRNEKNQNYTYCRGGNVDEAAGRRFPQGGGLLKRQECRFPEVGDYGKDSARERVSASVRMVLRRRRISAAPGSPRK